MRIDCFGGFGEKGRVCVGVHSHQTRILLDVGIKSAETGASYYPQVPAEYLAKTDGIIVSHSHEDHLGAAGHCVELGFCGAFYMTAETAAEATEALAEYADPAQVTAFKGATTHVISCGDPFTIGDLKITTGRSGHTVGGVWIAVDDGRTRIVHCGDVVPASQVLAMDPLPECDVLVIDASYGDDEISPKKRGQMIQDWVEKSTTCVLPTPLIGRSLELLALLEVQPAIHETMRPALVTQLAAETWFQPGRADQLAKRLNRCPDWHEKGALPSSALLIDDGMGIGGPSKRVIPLAAAQNVPLLGTGHLPDGSPLQLLHANGQADWLRMPTHPTLAENNALIRQAKARIVLAHSGEYSSMPKLAASHSELNTKMYTGDSLTI